MQALSGVISYRVLLKHVLLQNPVSMSSSVLEIDQASELCLTASFNSSSICFIEEESNRNATYHSAYYEVTTSSVVVRATLAGGGD